MLFAFVECTSLLLLIILKVYDVRHREPGQSILFVLKSPPPKTEWMTWVLIACAVVSGFFAFRAAGPA